MVTQPLELDGNKDIFYFKTIDVTSYNYQIQDEDKGKGVYKGRDNKYTTMAKP